MKRLDNKEKDYLIQILRNIIENLEKSEASKPQNDNYTTKINLNISTNNQGLDILKSALLKLSS